MISQPESYGLSPADTIAFTGTDAPPPDGFELFWKTFREEIEATPAHLRPLTLEPGEPSGCIVESIRSRRIAVALTTPTTGPARGCIVTSHGAEGVPDEFVRDEIEPWLNRGWAVLQLRVRGYPPSTMDTPDSRAEWIRKDIHDPEAWILRGGIADVVLGCRLARSWLDDDRPIALHGRSLSGGLAAIAAGQLEKLGDPPRKLGIALPSLGCWDWRFERYCNGFGAMVNQDVDVLRGDDRAHLKESIRLFDARFHAESVASPDVLCQLAFRDDHVPAPTAAAIFNAMPAASKVALLTAWGHFDGGIAHARKHLLWLDLEERFLCDDILFSDLQTEARSLSDDPGTLDSGWKTQVGSGGG